MFDNKNILITGGTGSLGQYLIRYILARFKPHKIVIYSRDEHKHLKMQTDFKMDGYHGEVLRWVVGDVRDKTRLGCALKGIHYVVHTAALKQVLMSMYNPIEYLQTNVMGTVNVIEQCCNNGVEKALFISTDKACEPLNSYGKCKAIAEDLFVNANLYQSTVFSCVRYGNVCNSQSSVIPFFRNLIENGATKLPLTDLRMTRFWITLEKACELILYAFKHMQGGEIYVPKLKSYYIRDLITAMTGKEQSYILCGIKPGEKLNEVLINSYENCYDIGKYYILYPPISWRTYEKQGNYESDFRFDSLHCEHYSVQELRKMLREI